MSRSPPPKRLCQPHSHCTTLPTITHNLLRTYSIDSNVAKAQQAYEDRQLLLKNQQLNNNIHPLTFPVLWLRNHDRLVSLVNSILVVIHISQHTVLEARNYLIKVPSVLDESSTDDRLLISDQHCALFLDILWSFETNFVLMNAMNNPDDLVQIDDNFHELSTKHLQQLIRKYLPIEWLFTYPPAHQSLQPNQLLIKEPWQLILYDLQSETDRLRECQKRRYRRDIADTSSSIEMIPSEQLSLLQDLHRIYNSGVHPILDVEAIFVFFRLLISQVDHSELFFEDSSGLTLLGTIPNNNNNNRLAINATTFRSKFSWETVFVPTLRNWFQFIERLVQQQDYFNALLALYCLTDVGLRSLTPWIQKFRCRIDHWNLVSEFNRLFCTVSFQLLEYLDSQPEIAKWWFQAINHFQRTDTNLLFGPLYQLQCHGWKDPILQKVLSGDEDASKHWNSHESRLCTLKRLEILEKQQDYKSALHLALATKEKVRSVRLLLLMNRLDESIEVSMQTDPKRKEDAAELFSCAKELYSASFIGSFVVAAKALCLSLDHNYLQLTPVHPEQNPNRIQCDFENIPKVSPPVHFMEIAIWMATQFIPRQIPPIAPVMVESLTCLTASIIAKEVVNCHDYSNYCSNLMLKVLPEDIVHYLVPQFTLEHLKALDGHHARDMSDHMLNHNQDYASRLMIHYLNCGNPCLNYCKLLRCSIDMGESGVHRLVQQVVPPLPLEWSRELKRRGFNRDSRLLGVKTLAHASSMQYKNIVSSEELRWFIGTNFQSEQQKLNFMAKLVPHAASGPILSENVAVLSEYLSVLNPTLAFQLLRQFFISGISGANQADEQLLSMKRCVLMYSTLSWHLGARTAAFLESMTCLLPLRLELVLEALYELHFLGQDQIATAMAVTWGKTVLEDAIARKNDRGFVALRNCSLLILKVCQIANNDPIGGGSLEAALRAATYVNFKANPTLDNYQLLKSTWVSGVDNYPQCWPVVQEVLCSLKSSETANIATKISIYLAEGLFSVAFELLKSHPFNIASVKGAALLINYLAKQESPSLLIGAICLFVDHLLGISWQELMQQFQAFSEIHSIVSTALSNISFSNQEVGRVRELLSLFSFLCSSSHNLTPKQYSEVAYHLQAIRRLYDGYGKQDMFLQQMQSFKMENRGKKKLLSALCDVMLFDR